MLNAFIQNARRNRGHGLTSMFRHLGALGLFFLAILDSSPLPTFGGPDILTAILAASHRNPWYEYAAVATAGSVIGALLTFRVARRAGSAYLHSTEIGSWMPFSAFFTNGEPVLSPPLQRYHFHFLQACFSGRQVLRTMVSGDF